VLGATTYGLSNFIAQARGGGDRANFQLNASGQRLEFNHYTLDGIENANPNYGTCLFQPSVDALQEFKVETGTYTAEYGHNAAQMNVVSRSGTMTTTEHCSNLCAMQIWTRRTTLPDRVRSHRLSAISSEA
jgi:hypothetical protein